MPPMASLIRSGALPDAGTRNPKYLEAVHQKFPRVKQLGMRRTGANQTQMIKFFHSAQVR
jgi:hypothetical protein